MSIEKQLLMFLHTIGHNQRNRVIAHNFLKSGETISRYFNHMLFTIGEMQHEYVRPPSSQTPPYIATRRTLYPYFKDCVGALDGTHIHASVPASEVAAFRGRKPYPTQNVLVVVDFDIRFTFILTGWEGFVHDSLVLIDALERPNGLKVPEGKYYLVDVGYTTRPSFIPPYRGVRFHLKEFGSRTPANAKELFNLRHSSGRTSIESAFGSLKNCFKILTSRPFFPFKTKVDLVLACCTLHNYILTGGQDEFIPVEEDWVPQRVSQTTARDQREEAQEWAARRDQIAIEMWANK
ncbi:protein ALP1-like [Dioscorea cayenensis subsp. rotundata]|uniref:Protein ALP1-like n=1 Tax=Dioscorea cayennensis subsp. rotundata TaxID=55577 RepID=A0AB40BQW5_DIOCR|nr:protein ALP1-like [Dioscorea cayenensis subsp. rotundata]